MTDLLLIMILVGLCVPGIWAMSAASGVLLAEKPDNKLSVKSLAILSGVQTTAIVIASAMAGTYKGPEAGIRDEFLEGLAQGVWRGSDLLSQLGAGALGGVVCSFGWLLAYYGWLRKRLDPKTLHIWESMNRRLGLWVRVTSGGIVEEVIFRWGLLTFILWGLVSLSLEPTLSFWIALLASGLVFGLAHLPGGLELGAKPTPLLIWTAVLGNLWVTLFCGYLLYHDGLIAAMIVHILFHVLWYPFERKRVE
ncbi:CPBP family intramembrane glutamic endopeptidase [Cohnella hongkongensis]|uniref:CPBP family intramembrane glutamic endopeptidase n=1 Tax=Cohnella hongkongensis TaxID=178337 RepID=A0ABV9FD73_9BACL